MQSQQFLLVGEKHGIVEVGTFTNALLKAAHPLGFQYFCIETDPFIAKKLEQLVGEGKSALDQFVRTFPLAIPFYDNVEDFQMLSTALQPDTESVPKLWGVDQVFAAAPHYLFQRPAKARTHPRIPRVNHREQPESYRAEDLAGSLILRGRFMKI